MPNLPWPTRVPIKIDLWRFDVDVFQTMGSKVEFFGDGGCANSEMIAIADVDC